MLFGDIALKNNHYYYYYSLANLPLSFFLLSHSTGMLAIDNSDYISIANTFMAGHESNNIVA